MTLSDWLFDPAGLTPHGFCLSWVPGLIYLHAISDAVIGISYFSIPLALASYARQRKDLAYSWVIQLFVAFILACGTTHLMSIVTLWVPAYGIEGVVKAITAVLSVATAVLLWPLIPKLVALPSPRQLTELNTRLAEQITDHERTAHRLIESDRIVRQSNAELERRVEERTAQLTAANTELTAALAQRDLLLKEVYHRVKNNLQVIDSLVQLQSRRLSDPDAKMALESIRARVHALGLVHQQLMNSADFRTFDISTFLDELSGHIVQGSAGHEVSISVKAPPLVVGLDFGIKLGLMVTELVTNSIKHAFPDGTGTIEVTLDAQQDGSIALVISDDGCGTDRQVISSQVRSQGLGMTILNGLVAQLKATMKIDSTKGTRTEIVIPEFAVA